MLPIQPIEKNTTDSKHFLKKIFLPFSEVKVYIFILSIISFLSSWLVETGGFLSFPYSILYVIPTMAIFAWPITIVISWFVGSLLVRIQKRILPNKKWLVVGIIIIIPALLLSYFYIHKYPLKIVKLFPSALICETVNHTIDKDRCYALLALKKNNPKICENLNYDKTSCYVEIAYQNDNMDMCNMLARDDYTRVEPCFLLFALKKEDWRICDKLNSKDRIECYANIEYHKKGDVCSMLVENGDFSQVQQCKKIISDLEIWNDR